MSVHDKLKENRPFFSIRTKFFCFYAGVMILVFTVISMLLPNMFTRYFMSQKLSELDNAHSLTSEILENRDILTDSDAQQLVESIAEASNVCIWVIVPMDTDIALISVFGYEEENADMINFDEFTSTEKELVSAVLNSESLENQINAFPSAFSGSTISTGYPQTLVETKTMTVGGFTSTYPSQKEGAVFFHVAMDDITIVSNKVFIIVFWLMLILLLTSVALATFLASNILLPVEQMKKSADAIARGDYSQEVVVTHQDEIGQLAESFNHMTRELAEADTLQKDFIANISHDFRSPLTSIKGYVEAMLDGTIPSEMFPKYLQIVLDEANRLTKMTNNVLDLTKMENGQVELHPVVFDVNEMIVNLALSLEQRVEERKIDMQFRFSQDKLYVSADLDLIQRVVYNLLDNALKFTDEGDSIIIETGVVGRKASISVADTGAGIDENSIKHIFDRFNKGDKSRGKNKMGTGLGLAIVKQILLNHGEDITVTSKVGEGTRFSFTLPVAKKKE